MKKSNKICGIYSITLTLDGRKYIGSSINIKDRWNHHKRFLRKNKHHSILLQRSFNKYGEDNFVFEILEECEKVKEIILEREQFYIDNLNPFFNIAKTAGRPRLGIKHTKKTKDKISNSSKGEKHWNYGRKGCLAHNYGVSRPDDVKTKISNSMKGIVFTEHHKANLSKPKSEQHRLNISKSLSGEKSYLFGMRGELNIKSKKYIIIFPNNKIEIIIGMLNFCKKNGLNDKLMHAVISGKRNNCNGYICFHYSEEKYQELLQQYPQQEQQEVA